MKHIWLVSWMLLVSLGAVGQTYSDASLDGKYSFNFSTPVRYNWSKKFTCPTNSAITYTPVGGFVTAQIAYGTATFNGAGAGTITLTNIGKMNATASANTMSVTWSGSCEVTAVNLGHVVYQAATTGSTTIKYSVTSSGSGTLTINVPGNEPVNLQLTAQDSAGIATTVLTTSVQVNGQGLGTGIAVHQ